MPSQKLGHWTVDYGPGSQPVSVPHAWRQDVDVRWEGPAVYEKSLEVPPDADHIFFEGVSYEAVVSIDGQVVLEHRGIWDAFELPLQAYRGKRIQIRVEVTKNGGAKFPVKDVASGFLPYVFTTFGGMFRPVYIVTGAASHQQAPRQRVTVDGGKVFVDHRPFYARGVLTWGWYPDLGHCHPSAETMDQEIRAAKELGFNLIKFCLWMPPHEFLEKLKKAEMMAWLELPLWDPNPSKLEEIGQELERIVEQYKHHDNILCWTVGCELNNAPPEFRQRMVEIVKQKTGSPLVKDNSGGAEMYGGDPREFGDFYDFHPYCDTPFYPPVLESLMPGARKSLPVFLGEYNDIDVHRDIAQMVSDNPYWISTDPVLNDKGVRWQYDFPTVLPGNRFTLPENEAAHRKLMESSKRKAEFMRKYVQESVRSHSEISGYVITGWVDTPISSSGLVFDGGDGGDGRDGGDGGDGDFKTRTDSLTSRLPDSPTPRFPVAEIKKWNSPACLFMIPPRRPPWVHGGNRPGWSDAHNVFTGPVLWRIGIHGDRAMHGRLEWDLIRYSWDGGRRGRVANGEGEPMDVGALESTEVGEIFWDAMDPGGYLLRVSFAGQTNSWPIWVVSPLGPDELNDWSLYDPAGLLFDLKTGAGVKLIATRIPPEGIGDRETLLFLTDEATLPMPFWREAAYKFDPDFWKAIHMNETWERLLPITTDRVIDPSWLERCDAKVLLNRIDTRTYKEHAVLAQAENLIVTTLRPFGGLGNTPAQITKNPAGTALLRGLMNSV